MKAFLPPLDSRWRLLGDFTPPEKFITQNNLETMTGDTWASLWTVAMKDPSVGQPPKYPSADYDAWNKRFDEFRDARRAAYGFDGVIPMGTIIQIERYHISRSGEDLITIKSLYSPSKFLTPKKQKGVMRGAGRLYFRLEEFNSLPDIEIFEGDLT